MMIYEEARQQLFDLPCPKCGASGKSFTARHFAAGHRYTESGDPILEEHLVWACPCSYRFESETSDAEWRRANQTAA